MEKTSEEQRLHIKTGKSYPEVQSNTLVYLKVVMCGRDRAFKYF